MIALDTNVLVRFLVNDDKKQADVAKKIIKEAELSKQPLFVTTLVVLELIWVLDAVYAVEREDIIGAISNLILMPALYFEKQSTLRHFINSANHSTFDLSDLLIALSAVELACDTTLTFDKKASKFEFFQKIEVD
ncbi:MAG TPA: PIN domain-containing protein [Leucothrix mucor]|nr:PIN domain-containing protein [Leucothrix mucor]